MVFLIAVLCFILIALERSALLPAFRPFVHTLYHWFVLLSGFGILLGVGNVFYIHLRRIIIGQRGWGLSLALVSTGIATLLAGLLQPTGVTNPLVEWIFDSIIAPGEATLFALLIFFMAAAAFRYLRVTLRGGAWMLAGTLLMLLVQMPVSAYVLPDAIDEAMHWLLQAPMMATFRGVLLGSALALLIVAARFLMGRTQP